MSDGPHLSGDQIGAGGRELHMSSELVQLQPTPFDGELQACAVFRRRALVAKQERSIQFLDIDPAILNRFEGVRVLQQAAGGSLWVSVGSFSGQFHEQKLIVSNA